VLRRWAGAGAFGATIGAKGHFAWWRWGHERSRGHRQRGRGVQAAERAVNGGETGL